MRKRAIWRTLSPQARINPFVKLALEFAPLALFFIANGRVGIFAATGVFMAAILVSLGRLLRVDAQAADHGADLGRRGAGLRRPHAGPARRSLHQDEADHREHACSALVLLGGLAFGKPLLPLVLDQVLTLTPAGWRKLTLRWAIFFFVLAALNEFVWRNFSTDTWVDFKVFGTMPLTLIFALSRRRSSCAMARRPRAMPSSAGFRRSEDGPAALRACVGCRLPCRCAARTVIQLAQERHIAETIMLPREDQGCAPMTRC